MPRQSRRRSASSVSLSQHLLRDQSVADRIIASTGLAPPSLVFDLGAGDGALTAAIAKRGCRVVAVEIDRALWARLKARFRDEPCVEPVLADLLQVELPRRARYALVSNVPFALTARLMRRLQDLPNPPQDAWLVMQAEPAQKWAGLGHETQASVLLKLRFEVEVVVGLRRGDFTPRPSVDCVVVRLRRRSPPLLTGGHAGRFEAMVRRAFSGPESARARELSLEDWVGRHNAMVTRQRAR
ncbi:MAG: rRNA adenine N(6)-methyltransferase family protein [Dehalococcoidia bacterium]